MCLGVYPLQPASSHASKSLCRGPPDPQPKMLRPTGAMCWFPGCSWSQQFGFQFIHNFFSMEMIFKQHKISHSEVDNSVAFHAFLMLCNHWLHLEQESSIPGAVRNQAAQQEETGS